MKPVVDHYDPNSEQGDGDTPSVGEVLQRDPEGGVEVPVRLVNRVRVDQLPMRVGKTATLGASSTEPERVLPANPKRGAITLSVAVLTAGVVGFRFATTKEACRREDTSFLIVAQQGPYKFHSTDELWVLKTAAGDGTERYSLMTEDWSR